MSKGITRRDWLKLIGGSAAGLMLTPIPWKILDETAKWSQNWSWTPVPRNGKINFKYTTCTLCPMSCGVRARCVGNQPVSLMGIPKHPISGGGLCAIGLGGHLLPYHPARLLQPYKIVRKANGIENASVSYEESISAVIEAISSAKQGSVAILDGQPRRTISHVYRKYLAAMANGIYVVPPTSNGIPPEIVQKVFDEKETTFGFDLENAQTILSFGAPVLDGWETLGQFSKIVKKRSESDKLKIIQVESIHTRTAQLADEWVPVKPGSEAAFALAIANVIINEKLCDIQKLRTSATNFENGSGQSFTDLAKKFSPVKASMRTGISEDKITGIAIELVSKKPSLVVCGGSAFSTDEQIVFMDLNILLGAVGTKGGVISRAELPAPFEGKLAEETNLVDVPDHSVKVLIMDGAESGTAFPWRMLQQKLVPTDPMIVSLSPYLSGVACHADYLIPSPAYLESYNDSPTPSNAAAASYSVSFPILPAPKNAMAPLDIIKKIAVNAHPNFGNDIQSHENLIRSRVVRLFKGRKGFVFDPSTDETTKLTAISSSEHLMGILSNGGCWYEEPNLTKVRSPRKVSFLGGDENRFERLSAADEQNQGVPELVLLPYAVNIGQSHQLMAKIYRESDLREPAGLSLINPETGKKMNLTDGGRAVIRTELGTSKVKVKFDKAVMPGVIQVGVGLAAIDSAEIQEQDILEICPVIENLQDGMAQSTKKIENDSTWRTTKAEIIPA